MSHIVDGHVSETFAKHMFVLAEACGAKLTDARLRTYAFMLNDVSEDDLGRAIYRCARERDAKYQPADPHLRLPSVAEIRSYVVASVTDAALLAWSAFDLAARIVGAFQSLVVDDECAAEALADTFGSWSAYCETDDGPQLALKRQEFLAAYRRSARDVRRVGPRRLPGQCESSGKYAHDGPCWAGRILAGGKVLMAMEQSRALLPKPIVINRLTEKGTD